MSDDAPRELEAKFEIDAGDLARLLATSEFGPFRVVATERRHQDDLYFDTPDGALRRAGSTLRVRRLADGALLTFKGAKQRLAAPNVAARLEDEVELPAAWAGLVGEHVHLPDELDLSPVRRARALAGAEPFEPVARLVNERVALRLERAGDVLELALDRCRGTRLSDGRTVTFDEVELEVARGGEEALLAARDALRAAVPGLRPSEQTKLARTLG